MENPPKWLTRGYCALFALLPWSLEMPIGGWKLTVPAEPLTLILGIGLAWHFFKLAPTWRFNGASKLFKISVLWIFWLLAASLFSALPGVSAKHFIVEAGQWWVFFFGVFWWPGLWRRVLPFFMASAAGSVIFVLWQHSFYHFRPDQSNLAPMPFFADHTIYSAALALLLPHFGQEIARRWPPERRFSAPVFCLLLLAFGLFWAGLYGSFCRAAWLSVVVAGLLSVALLFWKNWRWMVVFAVAVAAMLFFERGKISEKMATPAADGNAPSLAGQLRSLANFTTDASNLERLNRYSCALRMAADRPLVGFGPGAFQFQYLAYQRPEEMTRISVTEPITHRQPSNYGHGGGAHSEYLQALAEAGAPGFLCWLALVAASLAAGCRAFFRAKNRAEKLAALAVVLSLSTFFAHGLVNNFLHDGKIAALVWGQIAVLAANNFSPKCLAGLRPIRETEI